MTEKSQQPEDQQETVSLPMEDKPMEAKAPKKNAPKKTAAPKKSSKPPKIGGEPFDLPITDIVEDCSPRHEPAALYERGWVLVGNHPTWKPVEVEGQEPETRTPLVEMATSKDIEVVREFMQLIETYEGIPDRKENPGAPQSIVELAQDFAEYGQIYPVLVHFLKEGKCRLIDGGRRETAALYNYAMGRVHRHDKIEGAKQHPLTVKAFNAEQIKKDDVRKFAVIANVSRKQFTPLQEAKIYSEMCSETNPDTGKNFTMKEAAAALGVEYGTFRNRHALMKQYEPPIKDKHGIITKASKGLTDADRRKLSLGMMTLTAAIKKALGEGKIGGEKKKKKGKLMSLKEVQALFDSTPEKETEIREILAKIMGLTYKQAFNESEERIQNGEEKAIRASSKKRKTEAA